MSEVREVHEPVDHERVAVVTGASNGIGRAIAETLYPSHSVVLIARGSEALDKLAGTLGPRAFAVTADLTVKDDVIKAARTIHEHHPTVDALVNCVGARPTRLLTTMPFDDVVAAWTEELAVNLTSAALITYAIVPHLRRPGGRIVNIGSLAALTGGRRAGSAGYAAAKAGLHGLTLGLSRELAPAGITVNTVSPGFVAGTGITGSWGPDITKSLIADIPAGRAGDALEVAGAVGYLLSCLGGFVTGQCININGGIR